MPENLVEVGDVTYINDDKFYVGTLRLKPNSIIRVINAAKIVFECETLIIDGHVLVDTSGEDGKDGIPGKDSTLPPWKSGMHHEDLSRRHREWLQAVDSQAGPEEYGTDATPGTSGTDAGHFMILYRRLGDGSEPGSLAKKFAGGKSGKTAHGGQSRVLICGWHDTGEIVRRRPGSSWIGQDGRSGSVELRRF